MKRKIGIQGIKGAFHEEAAQVFFGKEIAIVPCMTFTEMVEELHAGKMDFALMAIENTISGTILSNLELIRQSGTHIIGEVYLRIQQHLGAVKGTSLDDIEEVRSHYMAINQCRDFFQSYPDISLVNDTDTALSIKEVAERNDKRFAAIGSHLAIEEYGLELLAANIETDKSNYTRFAVLSKTAKGNDTATKVSISLVLSHEPGTLANTLTLLHLLNVNLSKIESAPIIGKPFQYRFYMDLILPNSNEYEAVMKALAARVEEVVVLGRYGKSEISS